MNVTDFHNHLMPGVDDGAQDAAQARVALAALAAAGAARVITTPHVNGSVTLDSLQLTRRLAELDAAWAELQAAGHDVAVELFRGAEVALDVPRPDLRDARLRLAGGAFVLVEFAFMSVPPRAGDVLAAVRADGFVPILAHPERYGSGSEVEQAESWKQAGAFLQVNGGSLIGRYGPGPQHAAVQLVERGLADYISSDFHARGEPGLAKYAVALKELAGQEHAGLLLEHNPQRVLQQQMPIPVPPLRFRRRGLLDRVRELLR